MPKSTAKSSGRVGRPSASASPFPGTSVGKPSRSANAAKRRPFVPRRPIAVNLNALKEVQPGGMICNNELVNPNRAISCVSSRAHEVEICTQDIQTFVERCIRRHGGNGTNLIAGCTAWLTNGRLLDCLHDCAGEVLFVVNDELHKPWAVEKYVRLPGLKQPMHVAFSHMPRCPLRTLDRTPTGKALSACSYESVRACGNPAFAGKDGRGLPSLMHNKYMIFFESRRMPGERGTVVRVPCAILTGSFNMTKHANNNFENAVYIRDEKIASHLFDDFCKIFMHSRPLRCA